MVAKLVLSETRLHGKSAHLELTAIQAAAQEAEQNKTEPIALASRSFESVLCSKYSTYTTVSIAIVVFWRSG
jgi:hypothetical protein